MPISAASLPVARNSSEPATGLERVHVGELELGVVAGSALLAEAVRSTLPWRNVAADLPAELVDVALVAIGIELAPSYRTNARITGTPPSARERPEPNSRVAWCRVEPPSPSSCPSRPGSPPRCRRRSWGSSATGSGRSRRSASRRSSRARPGSPCCSSPGAACTAIPASFHQPAWLWLGGVLSAFILLSITFAAPRIGVAAAIGLVITGQLLVAAAIDRFGWFGFERIPLHWPRVLGIVLLAGGAALSLRK